MIKQISTFGVCFMAFALCITAAQSQEKIIIAKGNPIITDKYTADPAAYVYKDSVYLYTGHDVAAPPKNSYEMHEWLVYSSADMVTWKAHQSPLKRWQVLLVCGYNPRHYPWKINWHCSFR